MISIKYQEKISCAERRVHFSVATTLFQGSAQCHKTTVRCEHSLTVGILKKSVNFANHSAEMYFFFFVLMRKCKNFKKILVFFWPKLELTLTIKINQTVIFAVGKNWQWRKFFSRLFLGFLSMTKKNHEKCKNGCRRSDVNNAWQVQYCQKI